ncbi:MAG: cupin domain-containing protein [Acetobacteraceae bacterium]
MHVRARGIHLEIAGYEIVMEGADMRAIVLTLAAGQQVPWHYHSETIDHFFCLEGPMVVETRAPRASHELRAGQSRVIPPNTAHLVHGLDGGPCRFLLLQGIGIYDNVAVGG